MLSRIKYRQVLSERGEKYRFVFSGMKVLYPESWFKDQEVCIFSYATLLEAERLLVQLQKNEFEALRLVQSLYDTKPGPLRNKPLRELERFWKSIEKGI